MFRLVAFTALFAALASAQTASITGRVTDPGGATVPDATITAKSIDSGVSTNTRSNGEGYYTINALQPGRYELTVTKAGFAPITQTGLELEVQQVARLDFALQVGTVSSHRRSECRRRDARKPDRDHRPGGASPSRSPNCRCSAAIPTRSPCWFPECGHRSA